MKTNQTMIRPLETKISPFDLAQSFYAQHSELNFWKDLEDHLRNGVVISQPDCFMMAKIIELSDDPAKNDLAWFIRIAVGNIQVFLQRMPFPLPKIAFCRNNDGEVRVYDLRRFAQFAFRFFTSKNGNKMEVS